MPIVERAPGLAGKLVVSGLLIGVSYAAMRLAPAPPSLYKMADEVMRDPDRYEGRDLRVHGYVLAGSIVHLTPDEHEYVLAFHGDKLRVHHVGLLPDTFKDQAEVIEHGTLSLTNRGWQLDGTTLMAKCPTKYEGPDESRTKLAKFE